MLSLKMLFLGFWLSSLLVIELMLSQSAVTIIGIAVCLLCCVCGVTFSIGLDLLALTLLVVYSSVFLFMYILALYFGGTFYQSGLSSRLGLMPTYVGVVFFLVVSSTGFTPVDELLVWSEHASLLTRPSSSFVSVLHVSLFRFFIFEVIILNVYIFIGLLVALGILSLEVGSIKNSAIGMSRVAASLRVRRAWRRSNSSSSRS